MNLKVPGASLPLGCAILSTRARTVRGGWYNPPLRRTRVKSGSTVKEIGNNISLAFPVVIVSV